MTTIEKKMIVGMIVFLVAAFLMAKEIMRIDAYVEKNGIKPYVMQIWEGKK